MKMRTILFLLSALFVSGTYAHDESNSNAGPVLNKDGSIVTGVLAPIFDPLNADLPLPHNLFFNGSGDLTLNIPFAPDDPRAPLLTTLNSLDGFSTTEKWTVSFKDRFGNPGSIDPSSVIPGHSVRVFQITTQQNFTIPTGIVRELVAGVDFVAAAITPSIVGIIWLKPLPEYSSFLAVLTNDIKDTDGNDATPDTFYHLGKAHTPWFDANGSTTPLLDNASAQTLEGLRQLTNAQEAVAAAAGIDHEDIIISYTVQTQSITPTLKLLRSIAQPAATTIVPLGITTSVIGAPGIADVYQGIITLPYYLGAPTPENPVAPLREFWTAPPGGYVPPFDQFGFDPTSTHITAINPFPVLKSMQSVPVLLTVPNAGSGMVKPDNGWPVVIFLHGLGWNRGAALLVADTFASIGYAVIAIDAPLHGTHPVADPAGFGFLYIEDMPFGAVADERTFDLDFINNTTSAPVPDGIPDPSATFFVNLQSLLTTRDNARQTVADLSVLAVTVPTISFDGDEIPDLDGTNIGFTGWSGGAMMGLEFLAIEPTVTRGVLSVPGGGIARFLTNSDFFGPIFNGQLAGAGLLPGTADYELFVTVWQTAVDSGDPINWALEAVASNRILASEVINDDTIPNYVLTAPLSGTEPLVRLMGLQDYSSTIANPEGLQVVGRFLPPAIHSGLVNPEQPAITAEMQGQMASFIASFGTLVNVTNEATMVQVLSLSEMLLSQPSDEPGTRRKGGKHGKPIIGPDRATRFPYRKSGGHK